VANELTVTTTGGDGGLGVLSYDPGGGATSLSELQAATDAQIRIDGFTLDAPGNVITGAATGLTLTLTAAAPGSPTTVTVDNDRSASAERVRDFVQAYNSALQALRPLAGFDAASRTGGPLLGDATLRGFLSALRTEVVSAVAGAGSWTALYEIGVTTSVDGSLNVDDARLDAALAAGFDDVGRLFGTETTGLAVRLDGLIGSYLDTGGLIAARTDGLQAGIRDLATAREALDRRLEQVERRLRSQFSALDALVAQFQATGDFLSQQLASLNSSS
jgi:flagellar hook-associated protein 2